MFCYVMLCIYACVSLCVRLCGCMHVCMYVCMYVCIYVCVYVYVCVYHLNRCKTSYYRMGVWHSCPTTCNEAVGMTGKGNVAGFLYLQYLQINLYIYICIVPPLGAFKSQLGGTYSISLLFYTVNVFCEYIFITYIYIYFYLGSFHRVMLLRWCFLHVRCISQQNSQRQFWSSVLLMSVRQGDMSPSGNTCLGRMFDPPTWSLNLHF